MTSLDDLDAPLGLLLGPALAGLGFGRRELFDKQLIEEEQVVGGIDLAPATIDGLEEGWITAVLDQQLYLQGFLPVTQCVLSSRYGFTGMFVNTGSGTVTPATISALIPLIEAGIR